MTGASRSSPRRRATHDRGAAWSGDAGPVARVDVSVDGGRSWTAAALARDQRTDFGWRLWELPVDAAARRPTTPSWLGRAMRPATPSPSSRNGIPRAICGTSFHASAVRVGLKARRRGISDEVRQPSPPPALKSSCLACHDEDVIQQQRLTRAQWDAEINKMDGLGREGVRPGPQRAARLLCLALRSSQSLIRPGAAAADDRLHHRRLEVVANLAACGEPDDLRHEQTDDVLGRIDEEVGVERAAPPEAALRQIRIARRRDCRRPARSGRSPRRRAGPAAYPARRRCSSHRRSACSTDACHRAVRD